MLETIRKYWIGLLVIVLVGLHASIVGVIRYQASLAKIDASCEVDLGQYLAFQVGNKAPLQMRLHAIVPLNHRMKSRQLIDLNKAQIRQSLEEYLRQLDSKVLIDPYLADLKSQLLEVLVQTIGDSSIDDLVVTEVRESNENARLEFVSQGNSHTPRRLVATLRDPSKEHSDSDNLTDADHEPDPGDAAKDGEAEPMSKAHASPTPTKANAHAVTAKQSNSHASAAKKPVTSGHSEAKKPASKDAKKSGH